MSLISLHIFVITQLARKELLLTFLSSSDLSPSVVEDKSLSVCRCKHLVLLSTNLIFFVSLSASRPLATLANAAGPSQARHEWEAGPVQSTPSSRGLPRVSLSSRPGATPLLLHRSVGSPGGQCRGDEHDPVLRALQCQFCPYANKHL